jgi:hypothetical protein
MTVGLFDRPLLENEGDNKNPIWGQSNRYAFKIMKSTNPTGLNMPIVRLL